MVVLVMFALWLLVIRAQRPFPNRELCYSSAPAWSVSARGRGAERNIRESEQENQEGFRRF